MRWTNGWNARRAERACHPVDEYTGEGDFRRDPGSGRSWKSLRSSARTDRFLDFFLSLGEPVHVLADSPGGVEEGVQIGKMLRRRRDSGRFTRYQPLAQCLTSAERCRWVKCYPDYWPQRRASNALPRRRKLKLGPVSVSGSLKKCFSREVKHYC